MKQLTIGNTYDMSAIDKFADGLNLKEKVDGLLVEISDDMPEGVIGEIVMPLYYPNGEVACNFILVGYGGTSSWRCIYVDRVLEE